LNSLPIALAWMRPIISLNMSKPIRLYSFFGSF